MRLLEAVAAVAVEAVEHAWAAVAVHVWVVCVLVWAEVAAHVWVVREWEEGLVAAAHVWLVQEQEELVEELDVVLVVSVVMLFVEHNDLI